MRTEVEGVDMEAVWRVCRVIKGECENCPASETFDGDACVRGCVLQAIECINTVETGNPWRKTDGVKPPWTTPKQDAERAYFNWRDAVPDHRRSSHDAQYCFTAGFEAALRAQAERVRVLETAVLDAAISDRLDEAGSPLSWREVAEAAERERDDTIVRWCARMAEIREASGIGAKPMLNDVPGAIAERIAAAEARAEAAERRAGELEGALRKVDQTLQVPAAEYVPAIPDAWKIIDKALKQGGGQ